MSDLKTFDRKLDTLSDSLTVNTQRLLTDVGNKGKAISDDAVRHELGDLSMSNWWRGSPIQITTDLHLRSASDVEVVPTPSAAGPMQVLESGRSAGSLRGATRGRGTWTEATKRMEQELPKIVHEHTRDTLRKLFS